MPPTGGIPGTLTISAMRRPKEVIELEKSQRLVRRKWSRDVLLVFGARDYSERDFILTTIRAYAPGNGLGRAAMEDVKALAREFGWAVSLYASDCFGTPLPVLDRFYRSLGFEALDENWYIYRHDAGPPPADNGFTDSQP